MVAIQGNGLGPDTRRSNVTTIAIPANTRTAKLRRLSFLDGLRGCAALGVVLYHLPLITTPNLPVPPWTKSLFLIGDTGVSLFFVVSAFSLCLTMPSHQRTRSPLFSFYLKRLLRIAPMFYVAILFWKVRTLYLGGPLPTPGQLVLNVLFLFNLSPSNADSLIFAGWTIGVEMLFYVAFPLLFRYFSTPLRKVAALLLSLAAYPVYLGILALLPLAPDVAARYSLLTIALYLPALASGMLAFDVYQALREHRAARDLGMVFVALAVMLEVLFITGHLDFAGLFPRHWVQLACGMLLLGCALRGLPYLLASATRFFGNISYSVYLLHGPIIVTINPAIQRLYATALPNAFKLPLAIVMTLAVIVPVCWLTFRVVEMPGIALARQLWRGVSARHAKSRFRRPVRPASAPAARASEAFALFVAGRHRHRQADEHQPERQWQQPYRA